MTAEVSAGFYGVLRGACQNAADHALPHIGGDAVMVALLRSFPALREAVGEQVHLLDRRGRPDLPRVELAPASEQTLLRALRETHHQVFGWSAAGSPPWTEEIQATVRLAMALADERGAPWAGHDHLLEALLADPETAASEFLRRQSTDLGLLSEVARRCWPAPGGEPPRRALADLLVRAGVLTAPGRPYPRAVTRLAASGAFRLVAQAGHALMLVEDEAVAETVRLAHDRTTPAHLLLAVLVLEHEMLATGLRPVPAWAAAGDLVLHDFGVTREDAIPVIDAMPRTGALVAPRRRRSWRTSPRNSPWTVAAADAADRARTLARNAGGAHLLYAALTGSDDTAREVLRALAADPGAVRDRLADRLGL